MVIFIGIMLAIVIVIAITIALVLVFNTIYKLKRNNWDATSTIDKFINIGFWLAIVDLCIGIPVIIISIIYIVISK